MFILLHVNNVLNSHMNISEYKSFEIAGIVPAEPLKIIPGHGPG